MGRRVRRRRAEFNHRRWALLFFLVGLGICIYQLVPWVDCVYEVADAYKLGEGVEIDESSEAVLSSYDLERREMAREAANSGSYLAAVQFGAKACWGSVGFGFGRPAYLTHIMYGCFGAFTLLVIFGRLRKPRWRRDLHQTQSRVDERMRTHRRHAPPRVGDDDDTFVPPSARSRDGRSRRRKRPPRKGGGRGIASGSDLAVGGRFDPVLPPGEDES